MGLFDRLFSKNDSFEEDYLKMCEEIGKDPYESFK